MYWSMSLWVSSSESWMNGMGCRHGLDLMLCMTYLDHPSPVSYDDDAKMFLKRYGVVDESDPMYTKYCDFITRELQTLGPSVTSLAAFETIAMQLTKVSFPREGDAVPGHLAVKVCRELDRLIAEQGTSTPGT